MLVVIIDNGFFQGYFFWMIEYYQLYCDEYVMMMIVKKKYKICGRLYVIFVYKLFFVNDLN